MVMAELTDKEKAALLKQWAAETAIELLEREYSKPWSVKLSVRAGRRGFRAGMEWAESNRSFRQVECMAKNYGLILKPEDEALFDDDDNAELSVSIWDKEGDITYGWGWQAGVEAVYNKWIGK
jgi:hypothetical protein